MSEMGLDLIRSVQIHFVSLQHEWKRPLPVQSQIEIVICNEMHFKNILTLIER